MTRPAFTLASPFEPVHAAFSRYVPDRSIIFCVQRLSEALHGLATDDLKMAECRLMVS